MRILSQDGRIDFPYETVAINIWDKADPRRGGFCVYAHSDQLKANAVVVAKYSSQEKAQKAMEMLRKTYSPILAIKEQESGIEPNIKPNDWVVGTISPSQKVEVYDNFYFQFPADDELEG